MIRIGNIYNLNPNRYDENWLIVRKPDEVPDFVKHEPLLSPPLELFHKYREAYHQGKFNREFFEQIYVPQFLEELALNEDAIVCLKMLVKESKSKEILLACYCEDESLCRELPRLKGVPRIQAWFLLSSSKWLMAIHKTLSQWDYMIFITNYATFLRFNLFDFEWLKMTVRFCLSFNSCLFS